MPTTENKDTTATDKPKEQKKTTPSRWRPTVGEIKQVAEVVAATIGPEQNKRIDEMIETVAAAYLERFTPVYAKEPIEAEKPLPPMVSLYRKINAAQAKAGRVAKNGWNDFHKYAFATEGDIADHIRPILAEVGLAFMPKLEKHEIIPGVPGEKGSTNTTRVWIACTLADIDTGETFVETWIGEGQDKGDKGFYKAYTGAIKYFLSKTFLISTGDDPEADTSVDKDIADKDKQMQTQTDANRRAQEQIEERNRQQTAARQQQQPGPTPQQQAQPAGAADPTNNPYYNPAKAEEPIAYGQVKRLFALAPGDTALVKKITISWKYPKVDNIKRKDYDAICTAVQAAWAAQQPGAATINSSDIPECLQDQQ